jgi:serine protease AprX
MKTVCRPFYRRNLFLPPFLLLALCLTAPASSLAEEALNQNVTVTIENGKVLQVTSQPIPPPEAIEESDLEPKLEEKAASLPPDKIHPRLRQKLALGDKDGIEQVVVNFRDTVKIPRFPDLVPGQSYTSNANKAVQLRTAGMIRSLEARREGIYRQRMKEIGPRYGLEFVASFWLTDAMVVRMPLGSVQALSEHPDVLYIAPEDDGSPAPAGDGNALNDVIDGRARINSDPYFNLGLTSGFIGLLDTGMRFTHAQFTNPSRIGFWRDCVNGTANNCATGTGLDPSDAGNHGTGSAAILMANANQGSEYRGVTAQLVDSFKVYVSTPLGPSLNTPAVLLGFQAALASGDKVIVAEMQSPTSSTNSISAMADSAFDAGAAVIAANGNNDAVSAVASPANAHKVIGVGAVDVITGVTIPQQITGAASDGRIKPDVQGPTNTETASSTSDTALRVFGGTSGATPYVGAAAALLRSWLISQGASGLPGEVYVHLILSGQITWPTYNSVTGVGLISLPTGGTLNRGTVTVTTGQVLNIPLSVTAGATRLDAALWWPETAAQSHNDIDLRLIDPSGVERAASRSGPSVFERATVLAPISGNWTLRISGFAVPTSPQTVYYAAFRR